MPKDKSVADVKAELQSVLASELAARKFSYTRSDGSPWTLTLKDVVDRAAALEMAYNLNDCVELRWGAPEKSDEASTCKRHAPGAQRAKMTKYRAVVPRAAPARRARAARSTSESGGLKRRGRWHGTRLYIRTASFRRCCCRSTTILRSTSRTSASICATSPRPRGSRPSPSMRIRPRSPPAPSTSSGACSTSRRTRSATSLPLVNGIWADGSLEAARIARMAAAGRRLGAAGFSAGAVHARPERPRWRSRISSASPTPPICR